MRIRLLCGMGVCMSAARLYVIVLRDRIKFLVNLSYIEKHIWKVVYVTNEDIYTVYKYI